MPKMSKVPKMPKVNESLCSIHLNRWNSIILGTLDILNLLTLTLCSNKNINYYYKL
jgi:hypothetical protein